MISCRHCHADNPDGGRFCEACGAAMDDACPACGAANRASAQFCGQCGASLAVWKEAELPEEAERKQVSVLFADIRGSTQLIETLDPEAAMQQLDPVVHSMIHAVSQFGGVVNSVQGDGIMALFGAPSACEDHAVRACLAARCMIDAVARLSNADTKIRVGIDSGELIIRRSGRDAYDYRATGVIAHVASRMEQHATPGTAFITGRTARLARGYVDLAPLGRIAIKGLAEPPETFQLLSAIARPSWEVRRSAHALNRFVGRHAELSQMSAALDRAELGRGQVFAIVADAGFGKSRLVHEFLRGLPSEKWIVLRAAGVPHTAGAPYLLAAEMLRSSLGVGSADERAEIARKLTHTLALIDPEATADLAPLRSLLDLQMEDENWSRLAPSTRRDRAVTALRSVVLLEARLRPLILIVEDLQWADQPSVEFLHTLVDVARDARLLLLLTMRPDRLPSWTPHHYCHQLRLPALESESAATLLRDLIGPSAALDSLRRQILEQAGGVPLFIEEIAHSLTESGVIASQPAQQRSASRFAEVNIPASVQAIIAARIDRLPPARRRLLQVASVIGKDVPLKLLEAVCDLPRDVLGREIAELEAAEFLYEIGIPSRTEYSFRHVLIQTVAYEEMLLKHRRDLHARVMRAMNTLFEDRLDELTERLADHALRAQAWDAAVGYALKAGDRAIGRGAWREAVGFYDIAIEALRYLPPTPETISKSIEARLRLRVALPGLADLPRIAHCLDEARALAEQVGDPARLAEIDTSKCLTLTKMGRLEQAVDAGRQGYTTCRELQDKAPFLNASFALAQAYWYQGEFGQAEKLLTDRLHDVRGELRLKQTGTTGTASVLSLVCLTKTYAITGDFAKAFASITEARRIAEDTRKPFDLSYCGVGCGYCRLSHGDPRAAAVELEKALDLARSADIALLIPSSQRYLGRAYALVGRLQEARDVLREAIERTSSTGLLGMRLWSSAALAQVQLLDARGEARQTLMATLELARQYGFRPLQAHLMRMIGNLHAADAGGGAAAADLWYRRAIQLADQLGMAPEAARARRDVADLLLPAAALGRDKEKNPDALA